MGDLLEKPWESEPSRKEWRAHGFPCLIVRGPVGALCGYVALPPGHPWYGLHYDKIRGVRVHGGLTYSQKGCTRDICHAPQEGESDDVHWIGFDCAHAWDLMPSMVERFPEFYTADRRDLLQMSYRDINFVTAEVESLAQQAAVAHTGGK